MPRPKSSVYFVVTLRKSHASKGDVGGEEVSTQWIFTRRERGILVNSTVKTVMFWIFILVCCLLLWTVVTRNSGMNKSTDVGYSDLLDKIDAGLVGDATIQGTDVHGHIKGQKDEFHTTISTNNVDSLTKELRQYKVSFNIKEPQNSMLWPLLSMLLGFMCFYGAVLCMRLRGEVLNRERQAAWVREAVRS